jgi:energy-coupling factor transporter ATP-binding protein EcfA2
MAVKHAAPNQWLDVSDKELVHIILVISASMGPLTMATWGNIFGDELNYYSWQVDDDISMKGNGLALWTVGREAGHDLLDRMLRIVQTQRLMPQFGRILLVLPRMGADTLNSTESRFRDALAAIWEGGQFPAIEVWGAPELKEQLKRFPVLQLRYDPDDLPDGRARLERIECSRKRYDDGFRTLNGRIQFVGMSVYKEEATAAVEMDSIYIPLRLVGENADESKPGTARLDPVPLLAAGSRHVILGDPGCGKSTLLRFLALAGTHERLQQRYQTKPDDRLPILVTVRQYVDALKADPGLDLLDFIVRAAATDFNLPELDREFFEFHLYAGKALLFFDGVDELPGVEFKLDVRRRIGEFVSKYPGDTTIITSRIVGYEADVRYESLGFSHHRVARLVPEEVEQFAGNWYRARIPYGTERQRHVDDLVRLLRDPDHRAIRDLAENPLLLTIICLVHRVDAVLPDERVVLYQKCTETLLNTWHTWKFRGEDSKNRSRTEKQNRARMEAIAYWMHTAFDAADPSRRAITSEAEVLDFLAEYILEIEHPRDNEPREMARLFLRFVRERAGLLIEVGEGQYSFLHLTFQEYLAATHLKKTGEVGGLEVIWEVIKDKCANPRWHEVIRLLIGSLERDESQRFVLERIIPPDDFADLQGRALLAGGCLIDRIAPAEGMANKILRVLLLAAIRADSTNELQESLRQLILMGEREAGQKKAIAAEASRLCQEEPIRESLVLVLAALGWSDRDIEACHPELIDEKSHTGRLFRLLLAEEQSSKVAFTEEERDRLWCVQGQSILNQSLSGMVASLVWNTAGWGDRPDAPIPSFEFLLLALLDPIDLFADLIVNVIVFGSVKQEQSSLDEQGLMAPAHAFLDRAMRRARDLHRRREGPRDLYWARALTSDLNRARVRDLDRALQRARELARHGDLDLDKHWDRDLELARHRYLGVRLARDIWSALGSSRESCEWILGSLCAALNLRPEPFWLQALRVRFWPRVPDRITLTNPSVWHRTLQAFQGGTANQADHSSAAAQLLFDVWLRLAVYIHVREDSPFAELAERTRESAAVELRIAHCIRDIAYGDRSRVEDLEAMVESDDPELVRIFRRAFWVD